MAELHSGLPVEDRRRIFVQKRLRESLVVTTGLENIVRVAANVAIRAVAQFDKQEYAEGFIKLHEAGELDETLMTLRLNILYAGVKQLKLRCDAKHEFPKSCDCKEIEAVLMGQEDAVEPLPDSLGEVSNGE